MTKESTNNIDIDKTLNTFECDISPFSDFHSFITEEHIHFLKVDVEGNEINVFEGMSELLKEQKIDMIYLEVGFNRFGKQQTYFCKIDELLQKYNYRVCKFYEQTNEWIDDIFYLRRCNVLYISESFAKANPYKLTLENIKLKEKIMELK